MVSTFAQAEDSGPNKNKGGRREENVTFQLVRLAENVGKLGGTAKGDLSAEQANKILLIINSLRKRDSLAQKQAKEAYDNINGVLTDEKKGGGKGGPGGGPGGPPHDGNMPPPPRDGQSRLGPDDMKNFNPFNPSKNMPMAGEFNKKWDSLLGKLEKTAGISKKSDKGIGK